MSITLNTIKDARRIQAQFSHYLFNLHQIISSGQQARTAEKMSLTIAPLFTVLCENYVIKEALLIHYRRRPSIKASNPRLAGPDYSAPSTQASDARVKSLSNCDELFKCYKNRDTILLVVNGCWNHR